MDHGNWDSGNTFYAVFVMTFVLDCNCVTFRDELTKI